MHKILRGAVAVASGLAVSLTVTVGFEMPANAAGGCKTTFTRYSTVKAGSYGGQAKAAQCLLASAGYRVRADGSFSSADATKLKAFQSRHRLSRTGRVDARSWMALLARGSKPTLRYGSRGASVVRLQKALTASGRYVPATGWFGPITRNAVNSARRSLGWKMTGYATPALWSALQVGRPVATTRTRTAPVSRASSRPSLSSSSKGARALAFAKRQVGDRYSFGASGPNAWDCSGLTSGAWKSVGVSLPHSARQQFSRGTRVSKANLRPGDLVFFYSGISHVALYAGNGMVLHASNPRKPVGYLKMSYMPYQGARRPG